MEARSCHLLIVALCFIPYACESTQRPVRHDLDGSPDVLVDDGATDSSLALDGQEEVTFASPSIVLAPEAIDLGEVGPEASVTRTIEVSNAGNANLVVDSYGFESDAEGFEANFGQGMEVHLPWTAGNVDGTLVPPLVIEPGHRALLVISFTAHSEGTASAYLALGSNDPVSPEVSLPITATVQQARLYVSSAKPDFGGQVVGTTTHLPLTLISSGSSDLVITGLELLTETEAGVATSDALDISLEALGLGLLSAHGDAISKDAPLVIPADESITLEAVYAPTQECPIGSDGQYVEDQGALRILSNDIQSYRVVPLTGYAYPASCPVAVIEVEEGEEVATQTKLHLSGQGSYSPAGAITEWEWSVVQPPGSASVFVPSTSYPSPTFEANVMGEYLFSLSVWDEHGTKSCVEAKKMVITSCDLVLLVELTWETPGDPDPTDKGPGTGSDLDLHFAHPNAADVDVDGDGEPDPWFDTEWDCFWYYATQDWGKPKEGKDDPHLVSDESIPYLPEMVVLQYPEKETTYRIGVHYWDDNDFGPSYAKVKVSLYGVYVYESPPVELEALDMWEVATVHWPSGKVTPMVTDEGATAITHDYVHPIFTLP